MSIASERQVSRSHWVLNFTVMLALGLLGFTTHTQAQGPQFTLEEIVALRVPGQFVLAPDRQSVVYTAVGRYFGHPLLPAFGEDSNLVLMDLATGKRTRLTTGPASTGYPAFAPDGKRIAYESEGDIWSVDIATGKAQRLTTHHGMDRSAAWSPGGDEIAFTSNRWNRSGIYVMDASGERDGLREVTPQGFGGINPVWTPDGDAILFVAAKDTHFYSRGIYRVPAAGDSEPERLTPTDDARNNWPAFSPDGQRIAYISDRSGFLNIWTMSADGSDHRQVVSVSEDQDYPENDYIQSMGLRWSPDGRRILHFSNQRGNLRLIVADVASGAIEYIGDALGMHHPVGWLDDGRVAYVYESHSQPPNLYVRSLGAEARQLTDTAHAALRPEHMDRIESVEWQSPDGVTVHGILRRPSWAQPSQQLPALVFSHTYNVGQSYNQWNPIFSYIVESGYVVLMVNHRGSNGYGTAFRDLPKGNWGFAQMGDNVSGADYLRKLRGVDPKKVGILGYSMGGYMTQMALTHRPDVFAAGIAVFGLGQITGDPERSHQNYVWHLGGTEAEIPDAYRRASPTYHVENMQAPILLIHSDGDPIEPVSKVYNFVHELERYNKPYEVKIYSNELHGLRILEHQLDSYQRVMGFLGRHLPTPAAAR